MNSRTKQKRKKDKPPTLFTFQKIGKQAAEPQKLCGLFYAKKTYSQQRPTRPQQSDAAHKMAFAFGIEKAAAQKQKATRPPQVAILYTAKSFIKNLLQPCKLYLENQIKGNIKQPPKIFSEVLQFRLESVHFRKYLKAQVW